MDRRRFIGLASATGPRTNSKRMETGARFLRSNEPRYNVATMELAIAAPSFRRSASTDTRRLSFEKTTSHRSLPADLEVASMSLPSRIERGLPSRRGTKDRPHECIEPGTVRPGGKPDQARPDRSAADHVADARTIHRRGVVRDPPPSTQRGPAQPWRHISVPVALEPGEGVGEDVAAGRFFRRRGRGGGSWVRRVRRCRCRVPEDVAHFAGARGGPGPLPRTSTEEHDCGGRERSRPRAASRR